MTKAAKRKAMTRTELEAEFDAVAARVNKKITHALAQAAKNLRRAEELSEEHGIPFRSPVSPLGQAYVPSTFETEWPGLFDSDGGVSDDEDYREYNGVDRYDIEDNGSGWKHSAVC